MNKGFSGAYAVAAVVYTVCTVAEGAKCIKTGINKGISKVNSRKEEKRMWNAYYDSTKGYTYYYLEVLDAMKNYEMEVL